MLQASQGRTRFIAEPSSAEAGRWGETGVLDVGSEAHGPDRLIGAEEESEEQEEADAETEDAEGPRRERTDSFLERIVADLDGSSDAFSASSVYQRMVCTTRSVMIHRFCGRCFCIRV